MADFNRALAIKPGYPESSYGRGNIYIKFEDYAKALEDFSTALKNLPDDADTRNNYGFSLHMLGKDLEAIEEYNYILSLHPEYASALFNRGTSYLALERYHDALKDMNNALELTPDNHDFIANRGYAYQKLGRFSEAMADYEFALHYLPENAAIHYDIACICLKNSDEEKALNSLEAAFKLDPNLREKAKTDSDFDNIRHDPRFEKLVGED
jgi:tetratricopeptide (TPR) repeat protein